MTQDEDYKISVIIPVYGVEEYIEVCLRSLFGQTMTEGVEFILVNDCTPDNSMGIAQRVIAKYPRLAGQIKIVNHLENKGLSGARCTGIKASSGEYLIQIDSDDYCDSDMLESLYKKAVEEDADIVCSGFWIEFAKRREYIGYEKSESGRIEIRDLKLELVYSSLCNKLIRKSLYTNNNILPFEGIHMWEDLSQTIRLRYFSNKIAVVDKAFYHYNRQNDNSITASPSMDGIRQRMKCAELIELFFIEQHTNETFELPINYLKFVSKRNLLLERKRRAIKEWKRTFPGSNAFIWQYKCLSRDTRMIYWLANAGQGRLACLLWNLREKFKKLLRG